MDASQNRLEFKFVLPPGLGEVVRQRVGEMLMADRGAENGYPVLSEYFDTRERASYWQKQFGVANRRRLRSRVYGRSDGAIPASAFIEVKHKLDGVTVKRRVAVELADLAPLSSGTLPTTSSKPRTPSDQRILSEIDDLVNQRGSRPVVQIRYHRYAYDSGPEGAIRITFDIDPRCRFRLIPLTPDDPDFELPLLSPGSSIMEVKTIGSVPYWFRNIIGEFNLVPRGFSKYTAALELYEFKTRPPISQSPPSSSPPPPRDPPVRRVKRTATHDEKGRSHPVATATMCRPEPSPVETTGWFRCLVSRLTSCLHVQKAR